MHLGAMPWLMQCRQLTAWLTSLVLPGLWRSMTAMPRTAAVRALYA